MHCLQKNFGDSHQWLIVAYLLLLLSKILGDFQWLIVLYCLQKSFAFKNHWWLSWKFWVILILMVDCCVLPSNIFCLQKSLVIIINVYMVDVCLLPSKKSLGDSHHWLIVVYLPSKIFGDYHCLGFCLFLQKKLGWSSSIDFFIAFENHWWLSSILIWVIFVYYLQNSLVICFLYKQ